MSVAELDAPAGKRLGEKRFSLRCLAFFFIQQREVVDRQECVRVRVTQTPALPYECFDIQWFSLGEHATLLEDTRQVAHRREAVSVLIAELSTEARERFPVEWLGLVKEPLLLEYSSEVVD